MYIHIIFMLYIYMTHAAVIAHIRSSSQGYRPFGKEEVRGLTLTLTLTLTITVILTPRINKCRNSYI